MAGSVEGMRREGERAAEVGTERGGIVGCGRGVWLLQWHLEGVDCPSVLVWCCVSLGNWLLGIPLASWSLDDSFIKSVRMAYTEWWCRGPIVDQLVGILLRFVYVVDNLKLGVINDRVRVHIN